MLKKILLLIAIFCFGICVIAYINHYKNKINKSFDCQKKVVEKKEKTFQKEENSQTITKNEEIQYFPVFDNNIVFGVITFLCLALIFKLIGNCPLISVGIVYTLLFLLIIKIFVGIVSFGIANGKSFKDIFFNCYYPWSRIVSSFLTVIVAYIVFCLCIVVFWYTNFI